MTFSPEFAALACELLAHEATTPTDLFVAGAHAFCLGDDAPTGGEAGASAAWDLSTTDPAEFDALVDLA